MLIKQTKARHAALATAAFALVLVAAIAFAVVMASWNDGLRSEAEIKDRALAELARRLAARAPIAAGHAQIQVAANSALTETIAASRLQKQILEWLEHAGGAVHSVQAEAARDAPAEGIRKLVAQLTFDSSIAGLQRLLFDVETSVPLMFVDSLVVQPVTAAAPGKRVGDRVRVTLSVSSYWVANGKSASAP